MTTQWCTPAYKGNSKCIQRDGLLHGGRGVLVPPLVLVSFALVLKPLFCVLQMVHTFVRPHLPDVLLLRQDHLRSQQKGEQCIQREKTVPV